MASQDGSVYRMDPAETLWDCSIQVVRAGEDVVVEITTGTGVAPVSRLTPAAVRYSPGLSPARRPAA